MLDEVWEIRGNKIYGRGHDARSRHGVLIKRKGRQRRMAVERFAGEEERWRKDEVNTEEVPFYPMFSILSPAPQNR